MSTPAIPDRKDVPESDKWNLKELFPHSKAWDQGLKTLEAKLKKIDSFKGTLGKSPAALHACLSFVIGELGLLNERLGYYAHLRRDEDMGLDESQGRYSRYITTATKFAAAESWIEPEIQSIPPKVMDSFLSDPVLKDYKIHLEKLLRFQKHTLSEKEEALLAKQSEFSQTPSKAFNALTNVDLDFGRVKTSKGEVPLTQSTFGSLILNKDRSVREEAYRKFYTGFEGHKNTLAELYAGSVLKAKYHAEVRNYPSARAAALFGDKVPETVYDNLVSSVRKNLPALHDYYRLRRELLGLKKGELRHWDVYVSLVDQAETKHSWEQAVEVISQSLAPLGSEYVETLKKGLNSGWADRYENKGKQSGAYSAGSYTGSPYILMNYKEDVLRDVFTLAHEGGHSMHSWYSTRNNPFPHYGYTIFEAEVASTFNEQLLAHSMLSSAKDNKLKAYILGKQIDDVIATIYRQTMFAEFERDIHAKAAAGEPLTTQSLRSAYRSLLEAYFGKEMVLEEVSDLESLRIPHFYRPFYVYKYATGLSAAMALSRRVLDGGSSEKEAYLSFLKSGGSRYPLESLAQAGVDMSTPDPVNAALTLFASLVKEFQKLRA